MAWAAGQRAVPEITAPGTQGLERRQQRTGGGSPCLRIHHRITRSPHVPKVELIGNGEKLAQVEYCPEVAIRIGPLVVGQLTVDQPPGLNLLANKSTRVPARGVDHAYFYSPGDSD